MTQQNPTDKAAAKMMSDEELVELRKWWDAFGALNTPLAVNRLAVETIELRRRVEELTSKQTGYEVAIRNLNTPDAAAKDKVCAEILKIMETYREQEAADGVDTPGGLEHMGDVWRLFSKWERLLKGGSDAQP